MNLTDLSTNSLRMARVTHVSPDTNSFGCVYLDNGDYGRDVQLLSPYAGSDFGLSGMPALEEEGYDENMTDDPGKRAVVAVIAHVQGMPIALGFVFPQVSEMAFAEKGRLVERHTSDAYRTISPGGDMDFVHPSGAHIRIGTGSDPDELTGKDTDKRWRTRRNTGKAVTVTISNGSGGGTASVTMSPGGKIEAKTPTSSLTMAPDGTVDVQAPASSLTMAPSGQVDIRGPGSAVSLSAAGGVAIAAAAGIALSGMGGGHTGATAAGNLLLNIEGDLVIHAGGSITFEAGGDVLTTSPGLIMDKAPTIIADTPNHSTTGEHRDSIGGHCPSCP